MNRLDIDDIIPVSTEVFNSLNGHKNAGDAMMLWFRYAIQSRIQKTDTTRSTDAFMINAMGGWGVQRFASAKKLLKECGLIEVQKKKDGDGKFESWCTKVYFAPSTTQPIQYPATPVTGKTGYKIKGNIKKEKDTDTQTTVDGYIKAEFIKLIYDSVINNGFSPLKENPGVINGCVTGVLNSESWKREVAQYGDGKALVAKIMEYAFKDDFWRGRILGVQTFYYKWPMLIAQMKTKKLLTSSGRRVLGEKELKKAEEILSDF